MTFVGIDIGSSAVTAVLLDEEETVLAETTLPIATTYAEPGAAEQDADQWWTATIVAIDDLRRNHPRGFAAVRGIGLSGQMHAAVLLDEADAVIRPAMIWSDARALPACVLLDRQVPDLAAVAGGLAIPACTAAKLLWLRENEPDGFERIARVLSAKDYVRLQLTGEYATDTSDAAGTLMLDAESRDWSGRIVAASGITREVLPKVLHGPAWSGMVRPELLAEWGIDHQVVVAAGAAGVAAAAIGIGAIGAGEAFVSIDGGAQLCVGRESRRQAADSVVASFPHSLPDRWFDAATPVNGTVCLEWLTGMLGEHDIGRLIARAHDTFAGPSGLLFLPCLAGEQAGASEAGARGTFAGLDATHGQREMTRSVLEGIAFALREAEAGFGGDFPLGAIPLVGEGSRSALFLLIVASVLDRPLLRFSNADMASAFGAARLGRMAATGESVESVVTRPPLVGMIDPVPDLAAAYARQRADFSAFARSIREVSQPRAATADRRRRAKH